MTAEKLSIPLYELLGELGGVVARDLGLARAGMFALARSTQEEEVIASLPNDMRSDAAVSVLLSKLRWIQALRAKGASTLMTDEELQIEMNFVRNALPDDTILFEPDTIRIAWRRLNASSGASSALLPKFHFRGGPGQTRTDPNAEQLNQTRLQAAAVGNGRLLIEDFVEAHTTDVNTWNQDASHKPILRPLSPSTIARRFWDTFTPHAVMARNRGKRAADKEYRRSGARIRAIEPLVATQFDDFDGEVFLTDDLTGLPWGRAHLTIGIDEATSSFLGKELSAKPRDHWSALCSFADSLFPKDMTKSEFALCKHPWYAYGKIGEAQFDNALYNHTGSFIEGSVADADAIATWSKPHTPRNKSQIEHAGHLIKTDFTPELPGWRGPKRDRDGLKEGPGTAVMTLDDYRQRFNRWVCDRYSNKPQARGLTPRQMWDEHYGDRGRSPLVLIDTQMTRMIGTKREVLHFRDSGGLLRKGLRYENEALFELQKRLGRDSEVIFRIHPKRLHELFALDPIRQILLRVPCIETDDYLYRLEDHQQSLILKYWRDRGVKNPSIPQCWEAREALRKDVEKLRQSTKFRERKRAVGIGEIPPANPGTPGGATSPSAKTTTVMVSDLEDLFEKLNAVDLTDNAEGYREAVAA